MSRLPARVGLLALGALLACGAPDAPDVRETTGTSVAPGGGSAGAAKGQSPAPASLTFTRDGAAIATHRIDALSSLAPIETIAAFDPYYGTEKRWRAVPVAPVLRAVFGAEDLAAQEFVLRASDGYTVPISGARLLEPGGYFALADADGPWQPIGPTKADPAPCYLVWTGTDQQSLDNHPRPWALASIAIEPFGTVFPKVVPPPDSSPAVTRGFELWRQQCVRCHAINQQGGRVGPELNVPRNITEYRDEAYLRAWIRDPSSFRPGAMPSFGALTDDDLDALLAYLRAMAGAKDGALLPLAPNH